MDKMLLAVISEYSTLYKDLYCTTYKISETFLKQKEKERIDFEKAYNTNKLTNYIFKQRDTSKLYENLFEKDIKKLTIISSQILDKDKIYQIVYETLLNKNNIDEDIQNFTYLHIIMNVLLKNIILFSRIKNNSNEKDNISISFEAILENAGPNMSSVSTTTFAYKRY